MIRERKRRVEYAGTYYDNGIAGTKKGSPDEADAALSECQTGPSVPLPAGDIAG